MAEDEIENKTLSALFPLSWRDDSLTNQGLVAALRAEITDLVEISRREVASRRQLSRDHQKRKTELQKLRDALQEGTKRNESLAEQVRALRLECQELRESASLAHSQLERVYGSRSWRYTALLRRESGNSP